MNNNEIVSFLEARKFARGLKLKSIEEWNVFAKSESRPQFIPEDPELFYKDNGWLGWNDFLGIKKWIGCKEAKEMNYFTFKTPDGKKITPENFHEIIIKINKPSDDTNGPNNLRKGSNEFLPFEEAKRLAIDLGLSSAKDWREYCISGTKPKNMPSSPQNVYKDKDWKGWGDFLGTGRAYSGKVEYLTYEEARKFVSGLELRCVHEWYAYCRSGQKPVFIPNSPHSVYKGKGWKGYGDFLGTGTIAFFNLEYLPFEEAREFIQPLEIKTTKEWYEWCKSGNKPQNIPASPYQTYKDKGWKGWGDFLGTGTVALYNREYLSYEEAREFIQPLEIKTTKEWYEWCKSNNKPQTIPASPHTVYKGRGWKGWGDFLGTGKISRDEKEYLSFKEAKRFAHGLRLKGVKDWEAYSKSGERPQNVHSSPETVYKGRGWKGWGDFLGTGRPSPFNRTYMSYEETKKYVHSLNLKNINEWREWCKSGRRPYVIPTNPNIIYQDSGWTNWYDFFGTK
jgi:hypothetical protein